MTCVVVNDASCLIDLKKGELLHVLLRLPYRFIVPLPIRKEELLDFTAQEWRMLEDGGLVTHDLPAEEVARSFAQKIAQPITDRVSTGKFDDGTIIHDGGAPLGGGLCRNNKPTRCTAVIQIDQTPDSLIAQTTDDNDGSTDQHGDPWRW